MIRVVQQPVLKDEYVAGGGLLESEACTLSHHTLNDNYDSKFWKQLFIVCNLLAAAASGYLFYYALCLNVWCSSWRPAETDAVDICHLP